MKKIILWCKAHNLNYIIQDLICNCKRIELNFETHAEYSIYLSQLYKIRYKKHWTIDTHINTKTIWIYTTADAETIKEHNNKLDTLTTYFWQLIHEGKTSREAGDLQRQFAIKNGLYDVYKMYFERSATT